MAKVQFIFSIVMLSFILSGCGNGFETGGVKDSISNPQSEPPYYGEKVTVSPSGGFSVVNLEAKAEFQRFRTVWLTNRYVQDSSQIDTYPIPVAEFHVYDSAGNRIQAGETNADGTLDFDILNRPGTYTLRVFSRSFNNSLKVSVLNNLTQKTPHSVSLTFTLPQTNGANIGTATATSSVSGTTVVLNGGAFNIHYAIYRAVQLLKSHSMFTTSSPDKVTAYWTLGFNPYSYFVANSSSPLSFYLPDTNELFISGGANGVSRTTDTDQFDDSVIIHEYGHFLEDEYSFSASPGGMHDGNSIIDPRLAWSEGWANFFQGAVRTAYPLKVGATTTDVGTDMYIDTIGLTTAGGTLIARELDIAASTLTNGAQDKPINDGEGTFREFSIARTLYKGLGAANNFTTNFPGFWNAFVAISDVVTDYARRYTSFSLFYNELAPATQSLSSLSTAVATGDEKQDLTFAHYTTPFEANPRADNGTNITACERTISPLADFKRFDEFYSNQMSSNDFYLYTHRSDISGIQLIFSSGTDLDLILYDSDYIYLEDDTVEVSTGVYNGYKSQSYSGKGIVRYSRQTGGDTISTSGLSVGRTYLLNVKAFTAGRTGSIASTTYYLKTSGSTVGILCPDN